jgi:hypothetical protein
MVMVPPRDPEEHQPDCLIRQHYGQICTCGKATERSDLDERLGEVTDPTELTDREYARWLLLRDAGEIG